MITRKRCQRKHSPPPSPPPVALTFVNAVFGQFFFTEHVPKRVSLQKRSVKTRARLFEIIVVKMVKLIVYSKKTKRVASPLTA